ncbi:hypothetical protein GOBAR_AA32897 [Gossypium barbadense]|uniref:Conserved oligomeric Golgi complex subunit 8 n=1 Tax=Gossypium barbadense TaxID=3634 RepID=A0A2P5W9L8_GOSBA|nr:hypothetical protein GOBAR_AA32897 [Gossypium barbadense]
MVMGRVFKGSKWLKIGIMGMIMLARVTSEHEMGTPSDGSLCISECTTCPVICSPPPPSQLKSFSPPSPSVHDSPPEPDYIPPQLPDSQCSPPPLESNGDIAVSLSAPVASAMACLLPLASVSQQPYLSELLSFTLDRLHKEPELLRVDTERIQRQMLEVAVGNYRAFISAADALVAIKEEVSSINKHLESMITVIPNLKSGCTVVC